MVANVGKLLGVGLLLFAFAPGLEGELPPGPYRTMQDPPATTARWWMLAATSSGGPCTLDRQVEGVGRIVGVDPALLRAVVMQESGGNPHARSEVGAIGLTQLMPVAIRQYAAEARRLLGRSVDASRPIDNLVVGALYYRDALRRAHGNIEGAARLYHGGPNLAQHGPRTVAYGRAVAGRYQRLSVTPTCTAA